MNELITNANNLRFTDNEGFDYIIINYKMAAIFYANLTSNMKKFNTPELDEMINFTMKLMSYKNGVDAEFTIQQKILNLLHQDVECSLVFRFKDCSSQFMVVSNDNLKEELKQQTP